MYIINDLTGISGRIREFQSFIAAMNLPFPLHIACGYAFFDEDRDPSFQTTIRRALKDMHLTRASESDPPKSCEKLSERGAPQQS